jgi:hypothetical protein
MQAQLAHEVGSVHFDGARADMEAVGDSAAGKTFGGQTQDLSLPRS